MAADIPFMEVTGRKDVQNGGRSILKMTLGLGLLTSLSIVKIYFFLLFTSNLSYSNSFKLPHKIRLLGFRSPLTTYKTIHQIFNKLLAKENIPPVITLQYMYLCPNYIQTNLSPCFHERCLPWFCFYFTEVNFLVV